MIKKGKIVYIISMIVLEQNRGCTLSYVNICTYIGIERDSRIRFSGEMKESNWKSQRINNCIKWI